MEYKVFGIRHHGPGSANNLIQALKQFEPDLILVEGPEELDKLIHKIDLKELEPPVAALFYASKNNSEVVYYPYATFSPEWQSYLYAQRQKIPLFHIDLPVSIQFASEEELNFNHSGSEDQYDQIQKDPLAYFSSLAGYEDHERWWEVTFEHSEDAFNVFDQIYFLMDQLREEDHHNSTLNLVREAYMRKKIRSFLNKAYTKIAIVCGAWHVPALKKIENFPSKADQQLLKGLKNTTVKATWINWTYDRLSSLNGYKAGVQSPFWYELLFESRNHATTRWMASALQLLQSMDIKISSSYAIEAIRLAEALSSLRGLKIAGIYELIDAFKTVIGEGSEKYLSILHSNMIIGDKIGVIPEALLDVPLKKDIVSKIKELKLNKYKKTKTIWLKASTTKPRGGLDLRKEFDRKQSHFLHKLNLMNVNWGLCMPNSGNEKSNKNEYWSMKWDPEFEISFIEYAMWGNTIDEAIINKTRQDLYTLKKLEDVAALLKKLIQTDLAELIDPVLERFNDKAAVSRDIIQLLKSFPDLIHIYLYGDIRKTDRNIVEKLMQSIFPRICIGLRKTLYGLNEEFQWQVYKDMNALFFGLKQMEKAAWIQEWMHCMAVILEDENVVPLIRGYTLKLIQKQQFLEDKLILKHISYALSYKFSKVDNSLWLQGFIRDNSLNLILNHSIWEIMDQWLSDLNEDQFMNILPNLKKAFSSFSKAERIKMMEVIQFGPAKIETSENELFDFGRITKALKHFEHLRSDSI